MDGPFEGAWLASVRNKVPFDSPLAPLKGRLRKGMFSGAKASLCSSFNRNTRDFDLDYEGIDLRDLITTNDGSNAVFITDTLRTVISPDSTRETFSVGLPTQLSLSIGRKMGKKGQLMLSGHVAPGDIAPRFDQVLVNLTYHHQFTQWLMLGVAPTNMVSVPSA